MHERFIVKSIVGGVGYFGIGDTRDMALENLRKVSRKRIVGQVHEEHFTSELPFVPATDMRDANNDEADAYVDQMGATRWIRCERKEKGK